ncbi:hypothetical protein B0H13DRAFT_2316104 [Mycena leptocephala]|nr:hypothetical protein B0H13DRAFT_2316104 [Mycena leptocephala]
MDDDPCTRPGVYVCIDYFSHHALPLPLLRQKLAYTDHRPRALSQSASRKPQAVPLLPRLLLQAIPRLSRAEDGGNALCERPRYDVDDWRVEGGRAIARKRRVLARSEADAWSEIECALCARARHRRSGRCASLTSTSASSGSAFRDASLHVGSSLSSSQPRTPSLPLPVLRSRSASAPLEVGGAFSLASPPAPPSEVVVRIAHSSLVLSLSHPGWVRAHLSM